MGLPKLWEGEMDVSRWEKRREELVKLFAEEVYGVCPEEFETSFRLLGESPALGGKAVLRRVEITVKGPYGEYAFPFCLYLPEKRPAPVFVYFSALAGDVTDVPEEKRMFAPPVELVTSQGFAFASVPCPLLKADAEDGFRQGLAPAFEREGETRPDTAWATLAIWGFGASRILDYLETVPEDVDSQNSALIGFSRCGKAAAYAGARDTRFKLVIPHSAGCSGAVIARGTTGETVKNINDSFPFWFDGRYKKYNDREEEMPFDFHMLLACVAPRLLYVTSSDQDLWCDPPGAFRAWLESRDAFGLYGLPVPNPADFPAPLPPVNQPVWVGNMAYHVKTGGHSLTEYDWEQFCRFFKEHMG